MEANGITPQTMSPEQAQRFVDSVKRSTDPRIRDYNLGIFDARLTTLFVDWGAALNRSDMNASADEQAVVWERLYEQVCQLLRKYGTENGFGRADFLVVDDNYGWREVRIDVHHPRMLAPQIVTQLRSLLKSDPGWQISVAVHVPGTKPAWPAMGLKIRTNEIIDGLQRQYLPEPYRSFRYEGSRPGTEDE